MSHLTKHEIRSKNHHWKIKSSKTEALENPCLWMQAGAVSKKNCSNFYQCGTCKYDKGMDKMTSLGKQISWQDAMRQKDSTERVCRHSLTQRMESKLCPMNYNCSRCEFDQFFEDVLTPKTGPAHGIRSVKGFEMADDCYFHNGHTWASIDSGGLIKIGFDDFSLKVLGEPDALTLPLIGQELNKEKAGWGLTRKHNMADILSPISGVIMEVNPEARKSPRKVASDPYGAGWLFAVHTPDVKEALSALMVDNDSTQWMNDEITILEDMIESVAGPLAADGGYYQKDLFGTLPGLGWNNLTRTFLKT